MFGDSNAGMYRNVACCAMKPSRIHTKNGPIYAFSKKGVMRAAGVLPAFGIGLHAWALPATPMAILARTNNPKSRNIVNTVAAHAYRAVVLCFGFVDMNYSYFKHHHSDNQGTCFEEFMRSRFVAYMEFCETLKRAVPNVSVVVQEIPYNCITDPATRAKHTRREIVTANPLYTELHRKMRSLQKTHVVLVRNIHYTDRVNEWLQEECEKHCFAMLKVNRHVLMKGVHELRKDVIYHPKDTHYRHESMSHILHHELKLLRDRLHDIP